MSSSLRGCVLAEAILHDHARYDQYVEWSRPVLQKYKARLRPLALS